MGPDSKPASEIWKPKTTLISRYLSGKWKEELQSQEYANLTFCQEKFARVWGLHFCFKLYINQPSGLTTQMSLEIPLQSGEE